MFFRSFLILVLGVFIVPSLVFAACLQGDLLNENSNRCYKFVEGPLSFALAEEHCQQFGGHLVSISNGFESAMIFEAVEKAFGDFDSAWIGANKLTQSVWTWIDGLSFSYTNWGPGAGNQWKCAVFNTNNGMWYDVSCANEAPFVCPYPPVSSPKVPTSTAPPVIPSHCDSTWTYYAKTDSCYRVDYVNWMSGQPDDFEGTEHCVQTWSDDMVNQPTVTRHQWDDVPCDFTSRAYVCKKQADH